VSGRLLGISVRPHRFGKDLGPKAKSDVPVLTMHVFVRLKCGRIGTVVNRSLSTSKDSSISDVQRQSFLSPFVVSVRGQQISENF
jgi:hypothetical protein